MTAEYPHEHQRCLRQLPRHFTLEPEPVLYGRRMAAFWRGLEAVGAAVIWGWGLVLGPLEDR